MQRSVAAEPGEPPVTLLNIADVELFVSVTVPAVNWLPLFVVVSENTANVTNAARAPVTPTTTSVARPLRAVVIGFALHGNAPQPGARVSVASRHRKYGQMALTRLGGLRVTTRVFERSRPGGAIGCAA